MSECRCNCHTDLPIGIACEHGCVLCGVKPPDWHDGFQAGLATAAKHEPQMDGGKNDIFAIFIRCSCGQWDSRGGQSWQQHIEGLKDSVKSS